MSALPSDEEAAVEIAKIEAMTHEEMATLWRRAPPGHQYFDGSLPYYEHFKARFFGKFGGFTPAISKKIGW